MMNWKYWMKVSVVGAVSAALLFGCSQPDETATEPPESTTPPAQQQTEPPKAPEPPKPAPKPVTIKMGMTEQFYTPEEFELYVIKPVQAKYPHITVERVRQTVGTAALQQMIVESRTPDIILASIMDRFVRLELTMNIEPTIKEINLDLGRIQSPVLHATKEAGMRDYLQFIPLVQNFWFMPYNKGLFDRFGVAYPKDGLTYDDMISLTRQMTRHIDGTQFRGFEPSGLAVVNTLRVRPVNPATNQMDLSAAGWKRGFDLLKSIYSIPGNEEVTFSHPAQYDQFVIQQRLAMLLSPDSILQVIEQAKNDLNWDIAQFPYFPENPNTRPGGGMQFAVPMPTSQEKAAALQVIDAMISDMAQMEASRNGKLSILNNPEVDKEFAKNVQALQGKHVAAIFKSKVTDPPAGPATLYDSLPNAEIQQKLMEVLTEGKDVNTALREAEELGNIKIREQKAAQ